MQLLNRSGWLVVPKQPYVDWVNGLPASVSELEQAMSLAEHQAESRFYMVDETEADGAEESGTEVAAVGTDDEVSSETGVPVAQLPANWAALFENELSGWDAFADHWPAIEAQRFQDWFELRFVALVFDDGQAALMRASLE